MANRAAVIWAAENRAEGAVAVEGKGGGPELDVRLAESGSHRRGGGLASGSVMERTRLRAIHVLWRLKIVFLNHIRSLKCVVCGVNS